MKTIKTISFSSKATNILEDTGSRYKSLSKFVSDCVELYGESSKKQLQREYNEHLEAIRDITYRLYGSGKEFRFELVDTIEDNKPSISSDRT